MPDHKEKFWLDGTGKKGVGFGSGLGGIGRRVDDRMSSAWFDFCTDECCLLVGSKAPESALERFSTDRSDQAAPFGE